MVHYFLSFTILEKYIICSLDLHSVIHQRNIITKHPKNSVTSSDKYAFKVQEKCLKANTS